MFVDFYGIILGKIIFILQMNIKSNRCVAFIHYFYKIQRFSLVKGGGNGENRSFYSPSPRKRTGRGERSSYNCATDPLPLLVKITVHSAEQIRTNKKKKNTRISI